MRDEIEQRALAARHNGLLQLAANSEAVGDHMIAHIARREAEAMIAPQHREKASR